MKILFRISNSQPVFLCFCIFLTPVSHAEQFTLLETLGASSGIIANHTSAESACLHVVSVAESREHVFTTDKRIAGYPVQTTPEKLNRQESEELAKFILNDKNYTNIRQRCQNQFFQGVRFIRNGEKVEVAIGLPCNQVLVAYPEGKNIRWWGGILGNTTVISILKIIKND